MKDLSIIAQLVIVSLVFCHPDHTSIKKSKEIFDELSEGSRVHPHHERSDVPSKEGYSGLRGRA